MRASILIAVSLLLAGCSVLEIARAPRPMGGHLARRTVRHDPELQRLGLHHQMAQVGWEGDTLTVAAHAVAATTLIGPPLLPLVPLPSGYANGGNGAYDGEVTSPDRLWVSLLLTLAPGHRFSLSPCAATWIGTDTLRAMGLLRGDADLVHAAFLPITYACHEATTPISFANAGPAPERIHLLLRFQPGIRLMGGSSWTLRLPCIVNGVERTAEFRFRYGQWMRYAPLTLVNG